MMIHDNIDVECRRLLQRDGWTTKVLWTVFKRERVQVINAGRFFFFFLPSFFLFGRRGSDNFRLQTQTDFIPRSFYMCMR